MNEKALLAKLLRIECQLSPENLTCDGELSRTAVNRRFRQLSAEKREVIRQLGRTPTDKEVFGF